MARPVQRGRAKTSNVNKSNNSSGKSNQMVNTQIVRVICDSKKTRKRKKASSPKRDSKKAEAISKLKQALEMFNQIKERAMQAKVQIPAALGETPVEVSSVKTISDIESLTQTILSRVREIEALIQKSQSKPSIFAMPEQTGGFASEFTVNRAVLPSATPTAMGIPTTIQPAAGTDPNIEKKLKDLESGLVPGNPEDVKQIQTIEEERLRKQREIEVEYNTKRQALAAQLAAGKLDQAGFDREMKEASKAYNDALRINEGTAADKISELEKSKVGEGTEQRWKDVLKTSNTLKIRLNSIQKMGNVTEMEVQELEELQDYGRTKLKAFIALHRDDAERHPDLFPEYGAVKQQFKTSVRQQIKIPITDNRTRQDKVKHALRELEEINEMYLELKNDVGRGYISSAAQINKKLADIERQHTRVRDLNAKRGIESIDPALKDMEDTLKNRQAVIRSMMPSAPGTIPLPPSPPQSPSRIPRPSTGGVLTDKQMLRKFVNNEKGYRKWNENLTNAMRNQHWQWYVYRSPRMKRSVAYDKAPRNELRNLIGALLNKEDIPDKWYAD